jgi:iron complex transport system substrate-binding protein
MLFEIGAASQVVGVSSFDDFPPEAATRTRVGALLDPDIERILSLRPDLVVTYATQDEVRGQLARAGIATFDYRHGGLADIPATIRSLGARTGRQDAAERLASSLEGRLASVQAAVRGRRRPTTLVVFGRDALALRNIHASGGVGFLHDLLLAAGGSNVFADVGREAIQATTETILARAPEVIVELRYGKPLSAGDRERERDVWNALSSLPAVRDRRVYLLVGDEFVVPGPRIGGAAERLARAIHPEAFATAPPARH